MKQFECQRFINYKPKQIFDLIMDIEKYPQFLNWCNQAKIINVISDDEQKKELIADLTIKFGIFMQKYSSKVITSTNNGAYFINIESQQEIFDYLKCQWSLHATDVGSNVIFAMDVRFGSSMFEKIFDLMFQEISGKIISQFESRASQIYNNLNF